MRYTLYLANMMLTGILLFFAVKCAEMTLLRAKIRCFKINPKLQ